MNDQNVSLARGSAVRDPFGCCNGADVCIHNPEDTNNCKRITHEAHNCTVLQLQQYGLVPVNMCNLQF